MTDQVQPPAVTVPDPAPVATDLTAAQAPVPDPAVPPAESAPAEVVPAATAGQKTPLEILDSILNDAQAKSEEEAKVKEEAEKKRVAEEIARKKAEDQQKIADELAALKQVQFSPQEQAKADQAAELAKAEADYQAEMNGMTIHQLGHTKI